MHLCQDMSFKFGLMAVLQGGDLWHAMHNHETRPGLKWYKGGAQIALDIINGLHFLHSHNVSFS